MPFGYVDKSLVFLDLIVVMKLIYCCVGQALINLTNKDKLFIFEF